MSRRLHKEIRWQNVITLTSCTSSEVVKPCGLSLALYGSIALLSSRQLPLLSSSRCVCSSHLTLLVGPQLLDALVFFVRN